jgi:predicted nucleic acid-binding protein
MIVVSDTTPLNYLVLVEAAHILPALFEHVYVPEQVVIELRHPTAPPVVRGWIASPPVWLKARSPARIDTDLKLDPGEVHAISLAEELGADHILIDEWAARRVAAERGLHVIGTMGVLDQAAERNLIDLATILDRLLQTTFRVDRRLVKQLLERDSERVRRHGEPEG